MKVTRIFVGLGAAVMMAGVSMATVVPASASGGVTVTVNATGVFGEETNLVSVGNGLGGQIQLAASDPAISYSPPSEAATTSGTLTCYTPATPGDAVSDPSDVGGGSHLDGSYPLDTSLNPTATSVCSGLTDTTGPVIYDTTADSSYTVTPAPVTIQDNEHWQWGTVPGHSGWAGSNFAPLDGLDQASETNPTCTSPEPSLDGSGQITGPTVTTVWTTSCSGFVDPNYNISYAAGTATVIPETTIVIYNQGSTISVSHKEKVGAQLFTRPGTFNNNIVDLQGKKMTIKITDKKHHSVTCTTGTTGAQGNAGCTISKAKMKKFTKGFGSVQVTFAGSPSSPATTQYYASTAVSDSRTGNLLLQGLRFVK